jgi:hypothetical protein
MSEFTDTGERVASQTAETTTATAALAAEDTRKAKHPVALAFQQISLRSSSTAHSTTSNVQSRIMELAWRQKYSQASAYPFEGGMRVPGDDAVRPVNITVEQKQCGEQDGTGTGAVVWNAAHVLASFLCKESQRGTNHILPSSRVCDLGCGTGLTGLLAAKFCTEATVMCTDIGPVLELTLRNVATNSIPNVAVSEYWWGSGTLGKSCFDVILIADCILPKLYPISPLVEALDELLSDSGVCFVSYEHRVWWEYDPREKFRELCEGKGLVVERITEDRLDDLYRGDDLYVWAVKRYTK